METPIIFFSLAILVEAFHQFTLRKREFLAAVALLMLGAWTDIIVGPITTERLFFAGAITISFIGDLAMAEILKVTGKRIIDGIIFFAGAHILYLGGVMTSTTIKWELTFPIAFAVAILGYWKTAHSPDKPVLTFGAAIYSLVISTLFAAIFTKAIFEPSEGSLLSLAGIVLFMGSDMMIAFREFRRNFPHSERWVSSWYILGQTFLLGSVFVVGA